MANAGSGGMKTWLMVDLVERKHGLCWIWWNENMANGGSGGKKTRLMLDLVE